MLGEFVEMTLSFKIPSGIIYTFASFQDTFYSKTFARLWRRIRSHSLVFTKRYRCGVFNETAFYHQSLTLNNPTNYHRSPFITDKGVREIGVSRREEKTCPRNIRQFHHEGTSSSLARKLIRIYISFSYLPGLIKSYDMCMDN